MPGYGRCGRQPGNPRTRPPERRRQNRQKVTASPDTADQHSRHLRATPAKTHGQQASPEGNAEGTTAQVSRQTDRNGLSRNVPITKPRNARNAGDSLPKQKDVRPALLDSADTAGTRRSAQTRCPTCDERHWVGKRRWQAERRGKDKQGPQNGLPLAG